MFTFKHLIDRPLLDVTSHPQLGGNINGPSLIQSPSWVANPLGKFYLYFAHHEGLDIRLAYADSLTGPWTVYAPGTLHLKDSLFHQTPPKPEHTHPDVLAMIDAGIEGDYPHIASPDVHVDEGEQQIRMYFHGRLKDGRQETRLAISRDGISFTVCPELLGRSYFRVFQHQEYHYAIALGSTLYRSTDGKSGFKAGPKLTDEKYRHGAILQRDERVFVVWSRAEDCPERLLISELNTTDDWLQWSLQNTVELHRPVNNWEGANEPLVASTYGGLMTRAHQLRDPGIFEHDNRVYLLYSIAGEQGLGIGELHDQT